MRRSDIVSGAVLTLLGLATIFFVVPAQISGTSDIGIAPDVFPLTMVGAATLFAALLVVRRLVFDRAEDGAAPLSREDGLFIVGAALFLAAGYAAIVTLGFMIGGALVLALVMAAMGEWRHPVRLVLVALVAPGAIDLLFWRLFYVPLP